MLDIIERDRAEEMVTNHRSNFSTEKDYKTALACVGAVPPAKTERKKGHWKLINNGDAICSECGRRQKDVWDFDNWDNFCRHCGADMRGKK